MKLKLTLALLLSFCGFLFAEAGEPDYRKQENWVICEAEKPDTDFDVFYVYPTLFADKKQPLMRWKDNPKLCAKTLGFATAQTGIFGDKARVFAPFVRQLEYHRCLKELKLGRDWIDSDGIVPGVLDTIAAFRYYLENFNQGRPYILAGHSQGAMDIYKMMRIAATVRPDHGFIAAYLPGLPRLSREDIAIDFAKRGLVPASGAEDLGVIIVWNTQAPGIDNPRFTGNKTFCINPLNWRTDATPADKTENVGAFFYDYRNGSICTVPNFCGARIDTGRGALLVDLPVNSEYDAKGFMGQGVFHMNDIWFFAGNIRENAKLRVKKWKEKYGGAK
jgi:hypothetical protein